MLGLCRTGIFTDVSKANVPGWPIVVVSRNPAYRAAQYDEAQEAIRLRKVPEGGRHCGRLSPQGKVQDGLD